MAGTQTTHQCPECDGSLHADAGETVCDACGLVVAEDHLDRGPEWRAFESAERERTGAPLTRSRHDRGLSTEIGRSDRHQSGRQRQQFHRLRRHHKRAIISSKAERNRVYAFMEIRRATGALSLPTRIRDRACILFEQAQDENLLRGRSIEGFAAAALYAVCRLEGVSRTYEEIADVARATVEELQAAYDAMNRDLGLPTGPIDPREYLPRFANALDVPPRVEAAAREFSEQAHERGLVNGRNPCGVAAACLYAAARQHDYELTQKEAATAAGVTPVTLRSTYVSLTDPP